MTDKTNERFDRLLKAMVQGEPPKRKAQDRTDGEREASEKPPPAK